MHVIRERNVHCALPAGLAYLRQCGIPMPSRAGNCVVAPGPVTTVYERPAERVLFWPERDANPFFHLFEGLWMLAGRNDLAFVRQFVRRMTDFSDDGQTLHGAYGHRWRNWHGADQIRRVVDYLKRHPYGRRGVLAMWDPTCDLRTDEVLRDVPCNTQVLFGTSYGERDQPNRLNMTVFNRSNDIIWGLYGANAVHMSMLQEYVAAALGLVVGNMTTVSNNFHAYEAEYARVRRGALAAATTALQDPYTLGEVTSYLLVQDPAAWDRDLALFMEAPEAYGFVNSFFSQVAKPLYWAHVAYRKRDYDGALEVLQQCRATDWRRAATEWIERRRSAREVRRAAE